jgi:hypothetical protein
VIDDQDAFQRIREEFSEIIETQCWSGFGAGWYGIVRDLCLAVRARNESRRRAGEQEFYVLQIKEKLGTVRFYTSHRLDEELHDLIMGAWEASERTCEACGKPGKHRTPNALRVRCDECEDRETRQPESPAP